jgi:hypothetical protein
MEFTRNAVLAAFHQAMLSKLSKQIRTIDKQPSPKVSRRLRFATVQAFFIACHIGFAPLGGNHRCSAHKRNATVS